MFLKTALLLSLIINGYLYVFHYNTSEVVVETVKEYIEPEIEVQEVTKPTIKKSHLNLREEKSIASTTSENKEDKETNPQEEDSLVDAYPIPTDVAFDDFIAERLKYQFNLDEKRIDQYRELKKSYREKTAKIYQVPEDLAPGEMYDPTYKQHQKYYNLISEYHEKLKGILGPSRYQKYEKMRRANNMRVFQEWQESEGRSGHRQYMQF